MRSQVLPISIVRYITFAHHHVPYSVIFFVDVIYLSNGLFNVLLFSNTRPDLLPHDPSKTEVALDEGLGEVNAPTDTVLPRYESPANTHGPQLDFESGEAVRLSFGVTYEDVRRSMDSLGRFLFILNSI